MKPSASLVVTLASLGGLVSPDFDRSYGQAVSAGVVMAGEGRSCAQEVRRVASLNGAPQRSASRSLLAECSAERKLPELVFYHEGRLRRSLRALLRDPKVGQSAGSLLALIGVPDDVQLIVRLAPPPGSGSISRPPSENRWAYEVVCALLEPRSDGEWAFLRKAALNEYSDRWVDAGAIQTLKLIASPRSLQILEEARGTCQRL
jgi:hypothetical protein